MAITNNHHKVNLQELTKEELILNYQALLDRQKLIASTNLQLRKEIETKTMELNIFNELYDKSIVGYYGLDEQGTFIRINQTLLDWIGYEREELIEQMHITDILMPYFRENFKILFDRFKHNIISTNAELEIVRKDGTIFTCLLNSKALFDSSGKFLRTSSIMNDISERKKMEKELSQANDRLNFFIQEAEILNEEKDKFIGMASHDLRNPLQTIIMSVETLKLVSPQMNELQKKSINYILDSANRMSEMISELLDINKIERKDTRLHIEYFSVHEAITNTIYHLDPIASKKSIKLELINSDQKLAIQTDKGFLIQIIENLVSNAVKFSPLNTVVKLGYTHNDQSVIISVQDEGQGIPENEKNLLFKKFQKLSPRPTNGESSHGLGLAIVKEYVQQLGGEVWCESTQGIGSTFFVKLPYK
jgi:PAS domain S-box-containing protein